MRTSNNNIECEEKKIEHSTLLKGKRIGENQCGILPDAEASSSDSIFDRLEDETVQLYSLTLTCGSVPTNPCTMRFAENTTSSQPHIQ